MKFIGALSFIFLSVAAYGAENGVTIIPGGSSNYVIDDSSEYYRLDKKFSVLLESTAGNAGASGASMGYYIDRKSQVLLVLQSQSAGLGRAFASSILTGNKDSLSGYSIGAQYKYFFGNSFFVRGGAEHRELFFTRKYSGSFFSSGTSTDRSTFNGSSTSANISIGNTWQWQHLTLGFDWLRYNAPISSRINREDILAEDKIPMEREKEYYLKSDWFASNFHVGVSF